MRTIGKPLFNCDGSFKGYRGFAFDITREIEAEEQRNKALDQLKAVEAKLEHQNSLFKSAVSNMRQGLAMFDGEGNLAIWDEQFSALMNMPKHRLPCKHIELIEHWQRQNIFEPPFSEEEFCATNIGSDTTKYEHLCKTTDVPRHYGHSV